MISNAKNKINRLKKMVSPRRSDKHSKSKYKENAESTVENALSQPSSRSPDQSAENPKRRASSSVEKTESSRRIDDCDLDNLFKKFEAEHKTLDYSDLLKSFPWIVRLDYPDVSPDVLSAFMNDKNKIWGGMMGMVPKKDKGHYSLKGCEMLNRVGRHQFYEKFKEISGIRPNFDASGRLEANSKTNKIIQSFITSVANEIRTVGFRTRWKGADDARDAIQNFDMAANRHQQFGAKDWSDLCHAIEKLGEFQQWNNRAGSPENRDLKSPRKIPQGIKTMTVSPRKVTEKKPSAAFCRDFVSLINAHDAESAKTGETYVPGDGARPYLIKFVLDELARNKGRAGFSPKEEAAFRELTGAVQDDSKNFDQCWMKFRGIMESNSAIQRYRTKNEVVTTSKPTKLAGASFAPTLNDQEKKVLNAITETKSSKSSFDEQSEVALMPPWNKPWSPQFEYVDDLSNSVQSTELSDDFRGELVKMFQAHDSLRGANGDPYIPGPNGLRFVREMVDKERSGNSSLKGWHGKERNAFEDVEASLKKSPFNSDLWDQTWLRFRAVMEKHLTIEQLREGSSESSKSSTKSSKSSSDEQNEGALPTWTKPWSPQFEYVDDLLQSVQSTRLSDDFRGELVKMFRMHDGLPGANGGQYIPGPNGLRFVREMIEKERSRNSSLKGWHGKEKNAFEDVEASLKRSPQEFNFKLWDQAWLRFRAVMEKHVDIK
jgi:hypothetical protein